MVKIFPKLEHLAAPAFICGPVIASELVESLQSLAITDRRYDTTGPNLETMAAAAGRMPKVRKFALCAEPVEVINTGTLKNLLSAMPSLGDLKFETSLDDPVCSIFILCVFETQPITNISASARAR